MPGTIKPEDFSSSMKDVNRNRWTLGRIEHVVKAMEGRPALVEVDNRTGCAFTGEIVGYSPTGSRNPGARLHFRHESGQVTWYRLDEIGVIVDLSAIGSAKWDALDGARKGRSAALEAAKRDVGRDVSDMSCEILPLGFGEYDVTFRKPDARPYEREAYARVRV